MRTIVKKANIPTESALSVVPNSVCYKGVATSTTLAGEEIILMARTIAQLNIVWNKHFPSQTLNVGMCYEVVMLSSKVVTLDEI